MLLLQVGLVGGQLDYQAMNDVIFSGFQTDFKTFSKWKSLAS